jgi:tRNA (guanine26-N2/guanine27-N2)-dimethyltransferase
VLPRLKLIREGRTELYVPKGSVAGGVPETFPVFFNPAARTNRDISVSVARVTRPRTFLDALAGTGARGVRIANECGESTEEGRADGPEVTLVDFNRGSLAVARRNVKRNALLRRCEVVHGETNMYLCSRFERDEKFDAIDVDPFGTPASYLQAALMASTDGGLVSFTATDAAVLCGVYPPVSFRRYGALPVRNEFVHETGIRILLGFAARMGGINDIGVEPVLAHSTLHYFRAYVRVRKGATQADRAMQDLGYVTQCNGCHERWEGTSPLSRCASCGARVRPAGPLWIGRVVDEGVVAGACASCSKEEWREAVTTLAALKGVDGFRPFSYSLERACSRLKMPSTSVGRVIEELEGSGHAAARQPFEVEGVTTNATYEQFTEAVRSASLTSSSQTE